MMETGQTKKQRWVDYSSDGTSSIHSSESSLLGNPEIKKMAQISAAHEYIWLKIQCSGASQQTKKKIKDLRYQDKGNAVYVSKNYDGFEVKVPKARGRELLEKSIPGTSGLKITLGERNFPQDKRNEKKGMRKCNSERKNFGRNTGSRDVKNVRYIDKQTGKAPNNKQKIQKRLIEEDQRKYSRKEAQELGFQLGNFRSKEHKKQQPNFQSRQQYMVMDSKKAYETKGQKPKEKPDIKRVKSSQHFYEDVHSPSASKKVNPWKRKQTRDTSKTHENGGVKKEKGNINNHKSPKHYELKGNINGENPQKQSKALK